MSTEFVLTKDANNAPTLSVVETSCQFYFMIGTEESEPVSTERLSITETVHAALKLLRAASYSAKDETEFWKRVQADVQAMSAAYVQPNFIEP